MTLLMYMYITMLTVVRKILIYISLCLFATIYTNNNIINSKTKSKYLFLVSITQVKLNNDSFNSINLRFLILRYFLRSPFNRASGEVI